MANAVDAALTQAGLNAVKGVVGALQWVKQQLANARAEYTKKIIELSSKPLQLLLFLAGAVVVSIALGYIYDFLKGLEIVIRIVKFFDTVMTVIKSIGVILQVDTLLTLTQLAVIVDDGWAASWAQIYEALGDVAYELDRDFNFITAFAEVNKAILYSVYRLSDGGWLQAEYAYAQGQAEFLGNLRNNLDRYIRDPSLVFSDLRNAITKQRMEEADAELGKITAGIEYAGDWIRGKGQILIDFMDKTDAIISTLDDDIEAAIRKQFDPLKANFDSFVNDKWEPFFQEYDSFTSVVNEYLNELGLDVITLKEEIKDPVAFLRSILFKDEVAREEALAGLTNLLDIGYYTDLKAMDEAHAKGDNFFDVISVPFTVKPSEDVTEGKGAATLSLPKLPPLPPSGSWNKGEY